MTCKFCTSTSNLGDHVIFLAVDKLISILVETIVSRILAESQINHGSQVLLYQNLSFPNFLTEEVSSIGVANESASICLTASRKSSSPLLFVNSLHMLRHPVEWAHVKRALLKMFTCSELSVHCTEMDWQIFLSKPFSLVV